MVKGDLSRHFTINVLHVVPVNAIIEVLLVFRTRSLDYVQFSSRNGLERGGMTNHLAIDELVQVWIEQIAAKLLLSRGGPHLLLLLCFIVRSGVSSSLHSAMVCLIAHSYVSQ